MLRRRLLLSKEPGRNEGGARAQIPRSPLQSLGLRGRELARCTSQPPRRIGPYGREGEARSTGTEPAEGPEGAAAGEGREAAARHEPSSTSERARAGQE